MRKLFIPLAKLLGIFMIIRPLSHLINMSFFAILSFFTEQESARSAFLYAFILNVVSLFLALVLLFKTETVADILRLPDDNTNLVGINRYTILRIGLILIGFWTITYAIPILISSAVAYFKFNYITPLRYNYGEQEKILSSILRTILGICLVFLSKQIARFFEKQA